MSRIAYVNGQYVEHRLAQVHIEDRGYQFADGVYEVVGVREGRLLDEEPHLDRLAYSLKEMRIEWPVSRGALKFILREMARRNRVRDGLIYFQVTRGVAPRDHAFPKTPIAPALVVTAKSSKPGGTSAEQGISVITIPDIRWARCDIKTVGLLANVMGKQKARESGAWEAWQVDDAGNVTEGTSTNAWIVTADGELVTRHADHAILSGITRLAIKRLCDQLQLKLVERPFSVLEALKAREAFISSATSFVMPVVRIDGSPIGDGRAGALSLRLRDEYLRAAEQAEKVA
jgi:D-alanine transaminase